MSEPFKSESEELTEIKLRAPDQVDVEGRKDTGSSEDPPGISITAPVSETDALTGEHSSALADPSQAAAVPLQPQPVRNKNPLPARRRKNTALPPIYIAMIALSLLPLLMAACSMAADTANWDYFLGKYFSGRDHAAAVVDYSNAIKKHRTMQFLQERADSYGVLERKNDQAKDLQELVDNKVNNGSNYLDLATYIITTQGENAKSTKLLEEAFRLKMAHCKNAAASLFPDTHNFYDENTWASTIFAQLGQGNDQYREAAWDLVACGGSQMVLDALPKSGQFSEKRDLLLKAVALRETNKSAQSMLILNNPSPFTDISDWRWPGYEFFQALTALDHSDTITASKWVKKGWDSGWINNLTAAWLAYEQGKYSQALKLIDSFCKYAEAPDSNTTIIERQEVAAAHLLKAHVYLKLNKAAKAAEEFGKYKRQGSKGTIFIPRIYRNWLSEQPK